MEDAVSILLPLALVWGAAVMLPGPNFLIILWYAATHGRRAAFRTAAGVLTGAMCWIAAGLFGLHALFLALPFAGTAIKLGGAAYLVWFGIQLVLSKGGGRAGAMPRAKAYRAGLSTTLANPKSAAVAASLLAVALPEGGSTRLGVEAFLILFSISATWYLTVAAIASQPAVAAGFKVFERRLSQVAGALFIAFGFKLALER
jgi:threonine/homoserine/homoserine lactone efflux protein